MDPPEAAVDRLVLSEVRHEEAGNSKGMGGVTSHHEVAEISHEVGVVLVTSLHEALESLSPEVGALRHVDVGGLPHVVTSHQGAVETLHQEVVGTSHQGAAGTSHQGAAVTSHQGAAVTSHHGAAETSHRGAVEILHPVEGVTSTLRGEVALWEDHL